MQRKKWTDEMVAERIKEIHVATGKFPTVSFLKESGQNDLSVQICRRGGFSHWADKLDLKRDHSPSDTGWDGEVAIQKILESKGFEVERPKAIRWPFDLLVAGVLRIDVKASRFAEYGPCKGWFYRIGKSPQADLIALHQLDTGETYWIPWYHVPKTNITISKTGGIYVWYRERLELVSEMILVRQLELENTSTF